MLKPVIQTTAQFTMINCMLSGRHVKLTCLNYWNMLQLAKAVIA